MAKGEIWLVWWFVHHFVESIFSVSHCPWVKGHPTHTISYKKKVIKEFKSWIKISRVSIFMGWRCMSLSPTTIGTTTVSEYLHLLLQQSNLVMGYGMDFWWKGEKRELLLIQYTKLICTNCNLDLPLVIQWRLLKYIPATLEQSNIIL